jgi:uncharacterized integral membrane protein
MVVFMYFYYNNRYLIKLKYFSINHFFNPLSLLTIYFLYGQLIIVLPNFASVYKLQMYSYKPGMSLTC